MAKSMKTLKNEAMESCESRGHKMNHWRKDSYWRTVESCECTACGATVRVDTNPPPNGIDIMGSAVAINCGDAP